MFTWRTPVTSFLPGSPPRPRSRELHRPLLHLLRPHRRRRRGSSGGEGETTARRWNCCSSAAEMESSPAPSPAPAVWRPPRRWRRSQRKAETWPCRQLGTGCQKGAKQPPSAPPATSGPPSSNRRSGGGDVHSQQAPRADPGLSEPGLTLCCLGDAWTPGRLCPGLLGVASCARASLGYCPSTTRPAAQVKYALPLARRPGPAPR